MHDFECHFQFEPFCHIYRGLGKSKLHMVFYSIPYDWTSEIGGLVYHSDTNFWPEARKCHPGVSENTVF